MEMLITFFHPSEDHNTQFQLFIRFSSSPVFFRVFTKSLRPISVHFEPAFLSTTLQPWKQWSRRPHLITSYWIEERMIDLGFTCGGMRQTGIGYTP